MWPRFFDQCLLMVKNKGSQSRHWLCSKLENIFLLVALKKYWCSSKLILVVFFWNWFEQERGIRAGSTFWWVSVNFANLHIIFVIDNVKMLRYLCLGKISWESILIPSFQEKKYFYRCFCRFFVLGFWLGYK